MRKDYCAKNINNIKRYLKSSIPIKNIPINGNISWWYDLWLRIFSNSALNCRKWRHESQKGDHLKEFNYNLFHFRNSPWINIRGFPQTKLRVGISIEDLFLSRMWRILAWPCVVVRRMSIRASEWFLGWSYWGRTATARICGRLYSPFRSSFLGIWRSEI